MSILEDNSPERIAALTSDRIGPRIRALRQRAALTQTELGARSGGVKTGEVSRFETGQRTPGLETLARLAVGLNVTLPELVDLFGDKPEVPEAAEIAQLLRDQPPHTRQVAVNIVRALVGR